MSIGIQWPLVLFTLIAGCGCGLLAMAGFATLVGKQDKKTMRTTLIITLVLLGVGGLMSVFHLAHPERFMAAVANLLSFSGIALELIGLALSGVATLLFIFFVSTENKGGLKVVAVCSILIGVVATFLHGFAYYEVSAQAGWHSLALAFSYLFTSLTAGSLVFVALVAREPQKNEGLKSFSTLAMVLAAFATLAILVYVISLSGAGLLVGEALIFAVIALCFEVAAAGLSAYIAYKKSSFSVALFAALCAIGGGLFVRILMWLVSSYGLNAVWEATVNRGLYLF